MVNRVQKRPKGGATSVISEARCRGNVTSGVICFTCGVCFILSLTCTCLVTLVVLLDQTAEAASYDSDRLEAYTAMMKNLTDPGESFRLPKEVRPMHYDLFLYPDLDKGKFSGNVTILLDVLDKRRTLALHQKNLNITSVSLKSYDLAENVEINISSTSESTKNEMFVVSTENEFNPGLYNLYLEFNGSLENKIVGFYSSRYQQADNKTRLIATSKFEPTYARQAFPCFDEPSFKAKFTIQLVHPNGNCYNALSNMNVKHTVVDQPARGLTTVHFAESVPMSTYLACFIVSDFVAVTKMARGLNDREFPVSVYTTRLQPDEKKYFALDVGVKAIEYYINLYRIDYPLPKLGKRYASYQFFIH
ncbi:hypothetical protein DMN91_002918 [Ooceraea biroi]|uniref:Aminopeptidase N-like N-terminal domain-containing protein n=1 Tax=Ooceraea biroi TaxID=2015173 RepID=A0A3L8DYE0_OOCBI|nr:hypothetical protein DMN91_002918 [Ooceraea biroi]